MANLGEARLHGGAPLTEAEMFETMTVIMDGHASESDIITFLTDIQQRGETVDELVGAARVLRGHASMVSAPIGTVDCCGTGGDGLHTFNISTAVAFVAAACGVPVAKHGNRAASSKSGAADVLESLGINLDLTQASAAAALQRFNFSFLFAPHYHQAMRHVAAARRQIRGRTIFNRIGPLANPAKTQFQLVGVGDGRWLEPMAEALRRLGTQRAWVVHGRDGLDEITITGPTDVLIVADEKITARIVMPAEMGLPLRQISELTGGDAVFNARALEQLLDGKPNAYRDIVLANTAAVLAVHDGRPDLRAGVQRAAAAIDSGRALHIMHAYRDFSNEVA